MRISLEFKNYKDIFQRLIEDEEEAIDIYNALIGKCQKHNLRRIFFQFVQEETNHILGLKDLRKHYKTKKNFSSPIRVQVNKNFGELSNLEGLGYRKVLEFARDEEGKTMNLYQDIASQVKDQDVERLFLQIAEEERIHYQRTDQMLKAVD